MEKKAKTTKTTKSVKEELSYSELYYKYKITQALLENLGNKLPLFPDSMKELQEELDQLTVKEREVLNEMKEKIFL